MPTQPRDAQGRFAAEAEERRRADDESRERVSAEAQRRADYGPMNELLRQRGRMRARIVDPPAPGNDAMNKLLLQATGRLPLDDEGDAAA